MTDWSNPALNGAYRKGREAYIADVPRTRCPYPDHTTARGAVTFSRAFRHAWLDGWDRAQIEDGALCKTMQSGEPPEQCKLPDAGCHWTIADNVCGRPVQFGGCDR